MMTESGKQRKREFLENNVMHIINWHMLKRPEGSWRVIRQLINLRIIRCFQTAAGIGVMDNADDICDLTPSGNKQTPVIR